MLTSITPLGERGRNRRWGPTTAWYLIGSTAGGAAIGAIAGALGVGLAQLSLATRAVLLVGALGCLAAAVWDARGVPPPSWRRQVDETWLPRYRGWVVGGGFGLQLGFGVVTIVSSASLYAALLLAMLTGSFWGGLAVGTTFGLLRAVPLLTVRRVRSNEALAALYRRVGAIAPRARIATVGVLGLAAAALVAGAFRA
jgi:sulfite exporter TauE/SafE